MIGFIEGEVKIIAEDSLVIKTSGGVGYTVFTPSTIIAKTTLNEKVNLFIETIVKEDSITLFGFLSHVELLWFRSLLKVSGVGARIALLILSSFKVGDIVLAIETQDKEAFTTVSGIGEKLAIRLITELKKEPKKNTGIRLSTTIYEYEEDVENTKEYKTNTIIKEASLALESLGFHRSSIQNVVLKLYEENPSASLSEIIKLSLKQLKL
jgi:Holliday junction DNA helicase RuvA